jgi:hypothetical protein
MMLFPLSLSLSLRNSQRTNAVLDAWSAIRTFQRQTSVLPVMHPESRKRQFQFALNLRAFETASRAAQAEMLPLVAFSFPGLPFSAVVASRHSASIAGSSRSRASTFSGGI